MHRANTFAAETRPPVRGRHLERRERRQNCCIAARSAQLTVAEMAEAQPDIRRPLLADEQGDVGAEGEAPRPQWQFAQDGENASAAPTAGDADSWLYDESVANQPGCSAAAATLNLCTTSARPLRRRASQCYRSDR